MLNDSQEIILEFNLKSIMEEKKLSIKDVSQKTGLSQNGLFLMLERTPPDDQILYDRSIMYRIGSYAGKFIHRKTDEVKMSYDVGTVGSKIIIRAAPPKVRKTWVRTPSQKSIMKKLAIMQFIIDYKRKNDGCSPTIREIMIGCDISSTSVVNFYLRSLENEGKLKFGGFKSRQIMLADGVWMLKSEVSILEPA